MTDPSRRIAFDILKSVERDGAYSNILLNRKLQRADGVSAGLVRRLVHGVLQDQILLDAQIDRYLRRKNPKLPAKILLRLGFYQLIFCEDIPDFTAVDETVALAKSVMRGGEGFINAVLRSFLRDGKKICLPEDPQKRAEVQYSVPSWIAELWIRSYGPERAESLMKESCGSAPLCLRPNPLKAEGKTSFDLDGGIASSQDYKDGLFSVQDASAQEAVRILAPKPNERVLDVCAAPGGKTCAMAELMQNEGFIRACDIHEGKLSLIKKEAKRLGLSIIEPCVRDSRLALPQEERGTFDAVLCDVPCSGLGVLRRKPEIKLRLAEEDVLALPELQLQILRNAAGALKKGGRLLYSTCTVDPAENERVSEAFLSGGGFEKLAERQIFTGEEICGSSGDGFYYCLMRKNDL